MTPDEVKEAAQLLVIQRLIHSTSTHLQFADELSTTVFINDIPLKDALENFLKLYIADRLKLLGVSFPPK